MLRRVLIAVVSTAVGLTVLYLVGINVLLRTHLLRKIVNGSTDAVRIEYATAYSVVPWRIHVEGLFLRGSDSNVQWLLRLDRADFHLRPADLLRRRFHAGHIRAEGVSFRLRTMLDPGESDPKLIAALPGIDGFADPPLRTAPPKPPPSDADYKLVSVELDDVVAKEVREVWVETLRFTGHTHVTGRWLFRPLRELDVGPAHITVGPLRVSYGADLPIATDLQGEIDATIHPLDVHTLEPKKLLSHLSSRVDLKGMAHPSEVVAMLAATAGITVGPGEGPTAMHVVVEHGKAMPGSRVTSSLDEAVVSTRGIELHARSAIELVVHEPDHLDATLSVNDARLVRQGQELLRARALSAAVHGVHTDLGAPSAEGARFRLDVQGASADSLVSLREPLRSRTGVDLTAGPLTADAHVEGPIDDSDASGAVQFTARSVALARERDRVHVDVDGSIVLAAGSVAGKRANLTGSKVTLTNVRAVVHGIELTGEKLSTAATRAELHPGTPDLVLALDAPRVDAADARQLNELLGSGGALHVEGGRMHASAKATVDVGAHTIQGNVSAAATGAVTLGPMRLAGLARVDLTGAGFDWEHKVASASDVAASWSSIAVASARDGRGIFSAPALTVRARDASIGAAQQRGAVSVDLADGRFPDLVALSETAKTKGVLVVERGQGSASVHARVNLGPRTATGEAHVGTEGLRLKIGSEAFASNVEATLKVRPGDRPQTMDLSGTEVVATRATGGEKDGWWGRVSAPLALLTIGRSPSVVAKLDMEAQDATPGEALVAGLSWVPRWVIEMVPTEHLTATADLAIARSTFEVRSLAAHGGATSVRVEYAKRGDATIGGVLVNVGGMYLGVNLPGPGFVLFGADSWFHKKVAALEGDPGLLGRAE